MNIAVDIDEVLADFANPLDRFVKNKYGIKMDRAKWNTEEWWHTWGGSKTTAAAKIMTFMMSPEFRVIPVVPGAKEGIAKLREMGHELVIITGRPAEIMKQTEKWLDQHFPGCFKEVHSTDFHILKHGHLTKGSLCAKLGARILIDDFPHYAEECIANGVKVILFDTGYNHNYKEHDDIIRVKGWPEAIGAVEKLAARVVDREA